MISMTLTASQTMSNFSFHQGHQRSAERLRTATPRTFCPYKQAVKGFLTRYLLARSWTPVLSSARIIICKMWRSHSRSLWRLISMQPSLHHLQVQHPRSGRHLLQHWISFRILRQATTGSNLENKTYTGNREALWNPHERPEPRLSLSSSPKTRAAPPTRQWVCIRTYQSSCHN